MLFTKCLLASAVIVAGLAFFAPIEVRAQTTLATKAGNGPEKTVDPNPKTRGVTGIAPTDDTAPADGAKKRLNLSTLTMTSDLKLVTRGDLIADFRPDLAPTATGWMNHVAGAKSVGPLSPSEGSKFVIEAVDGPAGKIATVKFARMSTGTLLSEKAIPLELTGAGASSLETWFQADELDPDATIAAFGLRQRAAQRQFLYGAHKPLSGFFADVPNWGDYKPTAGTWHYAAWVYDSKKMAVYIDGKLVIVSAVKLYTKATVLAVGAGNTASNNNTWNSDPFNGRIASLRVMTGVLSADDVAANFLAGPGSTPGAKSAVTDVLNAAQFPSDVQLTGSVAAPANPMTLWYRQPAKRFEEALPIGNGRLGAMVYGGVAVERYSLNEGTLWSGSPYDPVNPDAKAVLPEVRRLIFNEKFSEAQNLINAKMMARPIKQMMYQPVGNLLLDVPGEGDAFDYRRDLDICDAVSRISYSRGGVAYTRETFATAVDNVIVVRLTADKPGKITFTASMNSPMPGAATEAVGDSILLTGRGSDKNGIPGKIRFEARVRVLPTNGVVTAGSGKLTVTKADSAVLLIAIATSFKRFNDVSGDPVELNKRTLAALDGRAFDVIRTAHLADYHNLFNRVSLDLGPSTFADLPTDERIVAAAQKDDPGYQSLYFQYARYLLISSSRPGGQPANLQGIWNESLTPPWDSKWTINVNTEMNYWPSEAANLAELNEPLFKMIEDLSITGEDR